MKKYDLSVIIASRNEECLKRTIDGILTEKRGNTEVIAILDGKWAEPPVPDNPDVTIIFHSHSIGQRGAVNEGAKLSQAKFLMKLDAHCLVDEGFDVKLMADCPYNWTVIPRMYNLHWFDWQCDKCKDRWYQSPTPKVCKKCGNTQGFTRIIVWKPRLHKRSDFMRFDSDLHFQYWGALGDRPESKGQIADTMSFVGACFFIQRKRYWDIDGLDEEWGSWGQMGTEISCKTWLSGGRLVVNKNTWFSHLFRTQGGDFGFPYPQSGKQVEHARKRSKQFFIENKWPKAKYPLNWLLKKFWPIPGWKSIPGEPTKSIVYYTDNALNMKLAHECRKQIMKAGLPIVSVSLKPMNFGTNYVVSLKRSYEAYFKQILTGLEKSTADVIFFCEHDWLYHPTHFLFTPPKKDVYYYNDNWYRFRLADGHAVTYDTHVVPSICAYREVLLQHYRKAYEVLRQANFSRSMAYAIGFEPGTAHRDEKVDNIKAESWRSAYPNLDIRHENNLTRSKWKQSEFRSQRNCRGWKEEDNEISGWGKNQDIIKRLKRS